MCLFSFKVPKTYIRPFLSIPVYFSFIFHPFVFPYICIFSSDLTFSIFFFIYVCSMPNFVILSFNFLTIKNSYFKANDKKIFYLSLLWLCFYFLLCSLFSDKPFILMPDYFLFCWTLCITTKKL